jgi:hypothetical protein
MRVQPKRAVFWARRTVCWRARSAAASKLRASLKPARKSIWNMFFPQSPHNPACLSDASPAAPDPWIVAYTGSVIENISLLRESMIQAIHRLDPSVQILSEPADPPPGALWRAETMYDQHNSRRNRHEKN